MTVSGAAHRRITAEMIRLHQEACQAGVDCYIDPETGYQVQTELAHLIRGSCCQSSCRHCPYGFTEVKGTGPESNSSKNSSKKKEE